MLVSVNLVVENLPLGTKLDRFSHFGVIDFLQKTNEQIRLYYCENCFRSFFGGNLRPQKTISKLTDYFVN